MIYMNAVLRIFTFIIIMISLLINLPLAQKAQNITDMTAAKPEHYNLGDSFTKHQNTSGFSFYGIYDRLLDTDSHNLRITHSAMSSDGGKLIFSGRDVNTDNLLLYMIDADGQNLTSIPIPEDFW